MPITLETHANEESTYKITAAFTDAAGDAVTPDSVTYKLTNSVGTVINSKTAEKAQLRLLVHYTPIKIKRLGALENIKIRVFGLFRQSQYDI